MAPLMRAVGVGVGVGPAVGVRVHGGGLYESFVEKLSVPNTSFAGPTLNPAADTPNQDAVPADATNTIVWQSASLLQVPCSKNPSGTACRSVPAVCGIDPPLVLPTVLPLVSSKVTV